MPIFSVVIASYHENAFTDLSKAFNEMNRHGLLIELTE